MKRILLAPSLLALALAGCNSQGTADNATANSAVSDASTIETTGSPASIGANGPSIVPTPKFVEEAAVSDMYEVQAAKIALTKSKNADIQAFAQEMVKAHTATTAKLKELLPASGAGVTPPAALDERRASLIERLQQAEPDKFDSVYLDQQTQAHREALGLMDSYAAHGDNETLKGFAAETKPKIQMHLDAVSKLDHGGADEAGPTSGNSAG